MVLRTLGILIASVVSLASGASAATLSATSCNAADVQAAINRATDGDTVIVPAGGCTWTTGISFGGKGITVTGSGSAADTGAATSGGTTITVNYGGWGLVTITESANGNARLSNLTFEICSGGNAKPFTIVGIDSISHRPLVRGQLTRIYNNTFKWHCSQGSTIINSSGAGVVDHNLFNADAPVGPLYLNAISALRCKVQQDDAFASWPTAATYGAADTNGTKNLYFETNTINHMNEMIDVDDACRLVFRYNTPTSSAFNSHGYDTSPVGARHYEIYNNTWVCGSALGNNTNWISQRGGTAVITDNILPAMNATCNYVNGGNGVAVRAVMQKLTRSDAGCWWSPFSYPVTRQIGWGWSGGKTVTQEGYGQDLEPTYFWNNTVNTAAAIVQSDTMPDTCGSGLHVYNYYQQGRDFYIGVAKPGYVKYQYPHPLVSGSSLPAPAPSLPAPSGLRVQ
jgi:hypothetical protein